jgi:hypothetical protein
MGPLHTAHAILLSKPARGSTDESRLFGNRWLFQYAHGVSVLSFSFSRFLNELHLGKLSETVIVHGNAPHNRPRFLVRHLIGNRASFLCTKAPMPRVPETNFLQGITSISGEVFRRSSAAVATAGSSAHAAQAGKALGAYCVNQVYLGVTQSSLAKGFDFFSSVETRLRIRL